MINILMMILLLIMIIMNSMTKNHYGIDAIGIERIVINIKR